MLNNLLEKAKPLIDAFSPENTKPLEELILLKERMKTKYEMVQKLDDEIINMTAQEQLEDVVTEIEDYHDKFQPKIYRIYKLIDKHTPKANGELPISTVNRTSTNTKKMVSLPKLELPTFNGNIQLWMPFHDAFTAAIDKNSNPEDGQKFQYLRAQLSGKAAQVVAHDILKNYIPVDKSLDLC